MPPDQLIGLAAALSAALVWAVASILFRHAGATAPPLTLNLYKGAIASVLLVMTLGARAELGDFVSPWALLILALSGAVGIGVGDTAFFAALNLGLAPEYGVRAPRGAGFFGTILILTLASATILYRTIT